MEYSLEDLKKDLESINFEVTPEQLAWIKEKYGDELAQKFADKKRIKKQIWILMQNNNILKTIIGEYKLIKGEAIVEMSKAKDYKSKIMHTQRKAKITELQM